MSDHGLTVGNDVRYDQPQGRSGTVLAFSDEGECAYVSWEGGGISNVPVAFLHPCSCRRRTTTCDGCRAAAERRRQIARAARATEAKQRKGGQA